MSKSQQKRLEVQRRCRNPIAVVCGRQQEFTDFVYPIWKEHHSKFRMVIPDEVHRHGGVEFSGHIVIGTADVYKSFEHCIAFIRSMTRWPKHPVGSWDMGPLG